MKDHEIVHFDLVAHLVAIYHIWRAHNGQGSSSFANLLITNIWLFSLLQKEQITGFHDIQCN